MLFPKIHKNFVQLLNEEVNKNGTYKTDVGAGSGAETFTKSEPEPKQIVSAPQQWLKACC